MCALLILKMCFIDESACDLCTPLHVYCIPDLGHSPCNDKNIQMSTAAYFVSIKRYNSIFNDPTRYVYVSLLIGCSPFSVMLVDIVEDYTPHTVHRLVTYKMGCSLNSNMHGNQKRCVLTHPEHPCGKLHLD